MGDVVRFGEVTNGENCQLLDVTSLHDKTDFRALVVLLSEPGKAFHRPSDTPITQRLHIYYHLTIWSLNPQSEWSFGA